MAIQISGTTVIDNSRNLDNINGADATTVTNLKAAGLGTSTTYDDVGTYVWGLLFTASVANNSTYAGSSIKPAGIYANYPSASLPDDDIAVNEGLTKGGSALSGTWRAMGRVVYNGNTVARATLFVRIS